MSALPKTFFTPKVQFKTEDSTKERLWNDTLKL